MTQEEKELLLKDLCARLPHKQKVCYKIHDNSEEITETLSGCLLDYFKTGKIAVVKPYLRPMSSMTEEEKNELRSLLWFGHPSDDFDHYSHRGIEIKMCLYDDEEKSEYDFEDFELLEDFLLKNHFDYRGLIEKGLALEATEDMYKNKEEQQ